MTVLFLSITTGYTAANTLRMSNTHTKNWQFTYFVRKTTDDKDLNHIHKCYNALSQHLHDSWRITANVHIGNSMKLISYLWMSCIRSAVGNSTQSSHFYTNTHMCVRVHTHIIMIIIIIITLLLLLLLLFINCNWVDTRWQWLFYTYTKHEIVY